MASHQVFQTTWKENRGVKDEDYQTGIDVVSAALNVKDPADTEGWFYAVKLGASLIGSNWDEHHCLFITNLIQCAEKNV